MDPVSCRAHVRFGRRAGRRRDRERSGAGAPRPGVRVDRSARWKGKATGRAGEFNAARVGDRTAGAVERRSPHATQVNIANELSFAADRL